MMLAVAGYAFVTGEIFLIIFGPLSFVTPGGFKYLMVIHVTMFLVAVMTFMSQQPLPRITSASPPAPGSAVR